MNTYRFTALIALTFCIASSAVGASSDVTRLDNIAGLRARIEIIRDREGVPHVRARNEPDALFGLGFVHAQDRLWQLEFMRRVGRGRLAELLGTPALQSDKLFRTLGVSQSAAATWLRFSPAHRELLVAYVAGLNAATDRQRKQRLPTEFAILNVEPESWRAEDVLVIAKVLAWSVDANWSQELLRTQLNQKLGPVRGAQLTPAFAPEDPGILPSIENSYARTPRTKQLQSIPHLDSRLVSELIALDRNIAERAGFGGMGTGSNNQVLSSARSTTGKPILASDPHLPAQVPSIFYRVHLTGGDLDVIGATAVGMPGVLMGHNGRVAWGWTNANADVQDLYIERLHEGREAEYNGALEPLQMREETIKVRGAADVNLTARATRHGPLVSDIVNPNGPALALRWAALDTDDDVGITANLEANRAKTWDQFTDAFRRFKAHSQNMVLADTNGDIAYMLLGTIPVRVSGDGKAPVPGWTSDFEWKGYIPFNEMPVSVNPQQGYLASSNNRIAPASYPYTLSNNYASPYRAARARELVGGNSRMSPQDLEKVQGDVLALHARELLPLLKDAPAATSAQRQAVEMLQRWDLRVTANSAAAAIFEAWYIQLAESIFADELGDALWRTWSGELHFVSMALASAVRSNSEWCDDVRTPVRETCQSVASDALAIALTRMATAQGTPDVASWQWGKVHRVVFFHQAFDADPVLSRIFNRVAPNGGDKHTLNVASTPRWVDYDQRHVALYRQVIDLSDFTRSRWITAPGQSGLVTDTHYDDLLDEWCRVEYRPMTYTRQSVDEQATERLILRP